MFNGEFQAVTHGSDLERQSLTRLRVVSAIVGECGGSDSPATWARTGEEKLK
jgi:hypothetical protein